MSANVDAPPTRGLRVRAVREAGGWDQDAFAELLNQANAAEKFPDAPRYDRTVISKMENGRRDVSLTDAALVAAVDPLARGMAWVAGVRKLKSRVAWRPGQASGEDPRSA